jgi:hypothetical protein
MKVAEYYILEAAIGEGISNSEAWLVKNADRVSFEEIHNYIYMSIMIELERYIEAGRFEVVKNKVELKDNGD